jgi:hypothetical protein
VPATATLRFANGVCVGGEVEGVRVLGPLEALDQADLRECLAQELPPFATLWHELRL